MRSLHKPHTNCFQITERWETGIYTAKGGKGKTQNCASYQRTDTACAAPVSSEPWNQRTHATAITHPALGITEPFSWANFSGT